MELKIVNKNCKMLHLLIMLVNDPNIGIAAYTFPSPLLKKIIIDRNDVKRVDHIWSCNQ